MIISEQWLRTWVDPDASTEELSHKLTMAGLEVDSVGSVAEAFSGVVVGEIVSAVQHPDADKLRVCEVSTGSDTVQIVCGAPNARAGLKAPLAQVGAVLPGNFKIKKAKLRGVESQGMLCAAAELTISEDNDGHPIGQTVLECAASQETSPFCLIKRCQLAALRRLPRRSMKHCLSRLRPRLSAPAIWDELSIMSI